MEAALLGVAGWLDAAGISLWARSGSWVYPVANSFHLLGLLMLVGGISVVDLRLAGLWRTLPAAALSRALTPVAIAGLAILAASGTILFAADGAALAASATFQWKLALVLIALANALAFRLWWQKRVEAGAEPGPAARAMAGLSILLWLSVGTLGRWIAYS